MFKATFSDGVSIDIEKAVTYAEVLASKKIENGKALAVRVNGNLLDLSATLDSDCDLEPITFEEVTGKKIFWHTSSHILAQATVRLFPTAKPTIGPSIDNGFYYDFDVDFSFTPENLALIEKEMKRIIKENLKISRFVLSKEDAIKLMEENKQPYKVELIKELPDGAIISFYKQGDFIDLCTGPHLKSTGVVKNIKILSVAGAYWRGDEKNKMLQRIYAISFPESAQLEEYLTRIEEAKRRDHRKLGKELDLFSIQDEGPGFPFFHPKGMVIRNILENFWRKEHTARDYQEIKTPVILNRDLWAKSGHLEHYSENMYFTKIDDLDFAIKPMNCPGSMLVYKRTLHSYRDLPLRVGELGLVHRHEKSGVLHGLMRVRCFTQDDAHIFMLPEQIKDEVIGVIEIIDYVYNIFGFKYKVELSTKPEKAIGNDADWDRATDALREALEAKGLPYKLNIGDGAFYGPKIDFHLEDSIGRTWQCGTIQLDFQLPERFDLNYTAADGSKYRPVTIHRVVLGSVERFIGILIEHFAGAFPAWIAPVQVRVMSITDRANDYVLEIAKELKSVGLRVEADVRSEKIGYKIREAQLQKIPYMLVAGDKEVSENKIAVRTRAQKDLGMMSVDTFKEMILNEVQNKSM